jgi:tetratricopeptide (TPR) repeat protein
MSKNGKKKPAHNTFEASGVSNNKSRPVTIGKAANSSKYLIVGLSALITFLVYLPCIGNQFLIWDDEQYITNNPMIRSFDLHLFKSAFFSFYATIWIPLAWLSHAADYAAWGLNPLGHHLTNVILHAVNTAIVIILVIFLLQLFKKTAKPSAAPWLHERGVLITAGITGLLFGLHPLHVESVAWATERKGLLSAFFYFLSIVSYLKYEFHRVSMAGKAGNFRNSPAAGRLLSFYSLSLIFFAFAVMSKPMALTLPLVLLIIDWFPAGRIFNLKTLLSGLIEKVPFILLSLGLAVLTLSAEKEAMWMMETVGLKERLLNALHSIVAYLYNVIWPLYLTPFYSYDKIISLHSFKYLLPFIIVIGVSTWASFAVRRNKLYFSVWVYFLITLFPALGIVQVGAHAMADRYLYLPSLSLFLLIGLVLSRFSNNIFSKAGMSLSRASVSVFAILILFALGWLTVRQIGFWRNDIALWSHAIQVEKSALVYWNRGIAFGNAGQFDQAIKDYDSAIEQDASYYKAYLNRGSAYEKTGRFEKAMSDFDSAIKIYPRLAEAYNNKGVLLYKRGSIHEAIQQFSKALDTDPENVLAYYNRGQVLQSASQEDALKDFNRALAINPDFKEVYVARGYLLLRINNRKLALPDFKKACDLGDDDSCRVYYDLNTPRK